MRYTAYAGAAVVAMWLVASLVVSWIVYDRSRLMDWDWVLQALGFTPVRVDQSARRTRRIEPALRQISPAPTAACSTSTTPRR